MDLRELSVRGAWEITPRQFPDERGVFLEWYAEPAFREAVGHDLALQQANASVSAAGVIRGIHVSDTPPGQAKYVTCVRGAVLDVVVDLRVGSPTFGAWDSVLLDDVTRRSVYLAEGLGHGFCSLEDDSTVIYLCSTGYNPSAERGVDAFDPELAIAWPDQARDGSALAYVRSEKDHQAPSLKQALAAGVLPTQLSADAARS